MSADPVLVARNAVVAAARRRGADRPAPEDVCRACAAGVDADGATLTAVSRAGRTFLASTDALGRALEEWQQASGEGPGVDAAESGAAVRVDDLGETHVLLRWPMFAPAAARAGAVSAVAQPVRAGGETVVGTLVVHRGRRGPLPVAAEAGAAAFAEAAGPVLLEYEPDTLDEAQAVLLQAAGMVAVQLGVDPETARRRLAGYALAQGRGVGEVARAVVTDGLRIGAGPAC